ncbi:MAG: hypothetical protein ROD09_04335 [Candidatus Sedimenticola sp. (ex Thyasira tokunagai)]
MRYHWQHRYFIRVLNDVIDANVLIPTLLKRIKTLPVGHYLDIRSYKRDRYLYLIKLDQDRFRIVEAGFEQNDFEVDEPRLKKSLKVLVKREFPRTNKIRLYVMGCYETAERSVRRKTI